MLEEFVARVFKDGKVTVPKHLQTTIVALLRLGMATAEEVAAVTEKARAVESAYLNQLFVMKIVTKSRSKRKAYFQVNLEALDW